MQIKPGISTDLLRRAYCQGFFPMPDPATGELVWMNPDPRAVIPLDAFHVSKSLRRKIQKNVFQYTINQAFEKVMRGCANRADTWINQEILELYCRLHREGDAHSVEVWQGDKLVGGVYGVCLGRAFFAESMGWSVEGLV